VLRDGRWTEEEAAILVPGDIISIKLGDIIPADARLLEGDPLKIDQVLPCLRHFVTIHPLCLILPRFIHLTFRFDVLFIVCAHRRIIASHQRSW
jgi:hypothetical protein